MPKPTVPLNIDSVKERLAGTRFADVRYQRETGSTNSDALELLGDPTARGTTIVTDYQTAGVGRKGRSWFAPPGSALLFTTILPGTIATHALWAVPFWIALAVAQGVEDCCGSVLELVWPNDLYARGGKTGGILSVARIAGDDAAVGCGVGLNVCRPLSDADLDALQPQPVFLDEIDAAVKREPLLAAILAAFDDTLEALHDPDAVARNWELRADLAGTTYRYRRDSDGAERDGIALRIGSHGALIVRDAAGETAVDLADVRIIGRARGTA